LFLPWKYEGDAVFQLQMLQNIIDSGWVLTNERLSAPFVGFFSDFMNYCLDYFVYLMLKFIYWLSGSLIGSINIVFLVNCVLTTTSSYSVLRLLHIDCRIAMMSALTYALSPYYFMRNEEHFCLSAYQFVPLAILLCIWCYSDESFFVIDKEFFKKKRNIFGLIFIILIPGAGSSYYVFFTCFLLLVSGFMRSKFRINKELLPSLSIIASLIVIFLFCLSPYFIYNILHGSNLETVQRFPWESEVYGLKIIQMFLPGTSHAISMFDRLITSYNINAPFVNENVTAYLGPIGSIGCIYLLYILFIRKYSNNNIFFLSRLNIAAILLSTVGGFSSVISWTITSKIRAYNRISVFIMFITILAVAIYLNELLKELNKRKSIIFIITYIVISALGILWQYPYSLSNQILDQWVSMNEPTYYSDTKFITKIENMLPAGSMIYQMPFHRFPGDGQKNKMGDYKLFIGLLHSKKLRWSYGAIRGRYADYWHQKINAIPLEGRIKILSFMDFAGIYIDRRAYDEGSIDALEEFLSDIIGVEAMYSNDNNLVFFSMLDYNKSFKSSYTIEYLQNLKKSLLNDIDNNEVVAGYSSTYKNLNLVEIPEIDKFTRNVYGIETHEAQPFVWIAPKAVIYLKHDDRDAKTIEIDLKPTIYDYYNAIKPEKILIYINDILVATEIVVNSTRRIISIDTKENIGIVQDNGYYKIEIVTDGLYNPYNNSGTNDNRDLALQLFEIKVN
jgi:hypothetical protein